MCKWGLKMKTCLCCGKEGPDEWFKTPAGDLCTRCRLAGKRVNVATVAAVSASVKSAASRQPGKLALRRKQRAELADAIRRKLRYYVFYSPDAHSHATFDYFGCGVSVLRERVRKHLPDGVRWEDYGKTWGLSFRRALHTYRLEQPAELKKATSVRNVAVVLLDKKGAVISGPLQDGADGCFGDSRPLSR